jgi:hypothetical protein
VTKNNSDRITIIFWAQDVGEWDPLRLGAKPQRGGGAHHSVPIYDRYVDNVMTLYRLRRRSGHSPDYTMYMYHTHSRINTKYL